MTRHTQPIVERLFRPMERSTRQRSSIRTVMEEAGRPLLPAEILGAAQREVVRYGIALRHFFLACVPCDGEWAFI